MLRLVLALSFMVACAPRDVTGVLVCMPSEGTVQAIDPLSGEARVVHRDKDGTAHFVDAAWQGGTLWVLDGLGKVVLQNGVPLSGAGPALLEPARVLGEPGGRILVLDRGERAVLALDPETGNRFLMAGPDTGLALLDPQDLTVLASEEVVVSDGRSGRLIRFPLVGEAPPTTVVLQRPVLHPGPMAAGSEGSLLILDLVSRRVLRVEVESGAVETVTEPVPGPGEPEVLEAVGTEAVAVGFDDGRLLVAHGPGWTRPTGEALTAGLVPAALATGLVVDARDGTPLAIDASGAFRPAGHPLPAPVGVIAGAVILDRARGIVAVDGTVLSGPGRGEGPLPEAAAGLARLANGRLAVSDLAGARILAVDPASGDRELLSGPERGEGPPLEQPAGLWPEPDGSLLVADSSGSLVSVAANGDRRAVSGLTVGDGPPLNAPSAVLRLRDGRTVVADGPRLLWVDDEGGRTLLTGSSTHFGPPFSAVRALAQTPSGELWAADPAAGVFRVNLEHGRRDPVPLERF